MNELLFSCICEKEALENILAFNQIKKCDEGISRYKREIAELSDKISTILRDNDIVDNYMEVISKYKEQLKNIENSGIRKEELNTRIKENDEKIKGFNVKIKEMESELESLKRVVFDSDDAKVIFDTQKEIETLNKRLEDLYALVESLNNDSTAATIELEFIKTQNGNGLEDNDILRIEVNNELNKTSLEFEEAIKDLELSVREDIEFCMKKIANREKEITKFENRKSNIIAEFPDSLNLDYVQEMKKLENLFEELDISNNNQSETIEDKQEDNVEEEEVSNIFDTPENDDYSYEEPDMEEDNDEESTDIDVETDMVKVESIEKPDLEFKEVSNAADLMEDQTEEDFKEEVENHNEEDTEIEVDKSNSFSTIGSVPYIFSEGESLESIAEKVYPSKDCWEAIYNYNKEEIDRYLTANGINNDFETIKTLASDKYLFAGIQLNIPTDSNYRG